MKEINGIFEFESQTCLPPQQADFDWTVFQLIIPSPALEYVNNYSDLLHWVTAMETARIQTFQPPVFSVKLLIRVKIF